MPARPIKFYPENFPDMMSELLELEGIIQNITHQYDDAVCDNSLIGEVDIQSLNRFLHKFKMRRQKLYCNEAYRSVPMEIDLSLDGMEVEKIYEIRHVGKWVEFFFGDKFSDSFDECCKNYIYDMCVGCSGIYNEIQTTGVRGKYILFEGDKPFCFCTKDGVPIISDITVWEGYIDDFKSNFPRRLRDYFDGRSEENKQRDNA